MNQENSTKITIDEVAGYIKLENSGNTIITDLNGNKKENMKQLTGIEKVNKVCKQVLKITEEDIQECLKMAQEQMDYMHPLKIATQRKYNEMGRNNSRVIETIAILKKYIQANEEPSKVDQENQ